MEAAKNSNDDFDYNNIAFVTLKSEKIREDYLKAFQAIKQGLCQRFCNYMRSWCVNVRRPYHLTRALEPDDIQWMNVGFSKRSKRWSVLKSNILMQLVLGVSLYIQIFVKLQEKKFIGDLENSDEFYKSTYVLLLEQTSSIVIILINFVLTLLATKLSEAELHVSKTQFYISHTKRIVWAQIINTGFVTYFIFVFADPKLFGGTSTMSRTLFSIFSTNLVITPLLNILDFGYFFKLWRQSSVKKQLERKELVVMTQSDLNTLFEGPDIQISLRYANLIKWLLLACFFSNQLPSGVILIFIFINIQALVDRQLMLRRYKQPLRLNKDLCIEISEFCEAAPFFFCLGNFLSNGTTLLQTSFTSKEYILETCLLIITFLMYILPVADIAKFFRKKDSDTDDSWNYAQMAATAQNVHTQPDFEDVEANLDLE